MRRPFTELYVHLVWATWDRRPLITPEIQPKIYASIQAECTQLGCEVLALGGIEDHVHLLVRLPTTVSVAELVKQVKGASSHLVSQVLDPGLGFKWQGAYGAFTLSRSHLPRIIDYVQRQREHHRDGSLHGDLEAVFDEVDPSRGTPGG